MYTVHFYDISLKKGVINLYIFTHKSLKLWDQVLK